jgi:NTE family protein
MAIKSSLLTLIFSGLFLIACQTAPSTKPTTTGGKIGPVMRPEETVPVAPATETPLPPPPQKEEPKKVAVILGPGGAKAFAHVGVLHALQQQRVPIDKVIGLEWGALVGGLFANKGQVNDLEWKLYKMEQAHLPHPKGFFKRSDDTVRVMDDFFSDAFGKDEIQRAKIPFECPARSLYSGVVAWQDRAGFREAMRRCMPYPPVFQIQGSFIAGASQGLEAIEHLAKQGYNVIILVNVLGSAMPVAQDALLENVNYVILWQEVKRALGEASKLNVETINVDTSNFPVSNFDGKKELIQLGEAAGSRAAGSLITKYGF